MKTQQVVTYRGAYVPTEIDLCGQHSTDEAAGMSLGSVQHGEHAGKCEVCARPKCPKCKRATTDDQQHGVIRHADESGDGMVHDGGCDACCACVASASEAR